MPDPHAASSARAALSVGIAGLGNVGTDVARWLAAHASPLLRLRMASDVDLAAVAATLATIDAGARAATLDEIVEHCDVVVECLAPQAAASLLERCVDRGRTIVAISTCALLARPELIERARRAGTRLIVPSGAVAGLDALRAAAMGRVHAVRVRTSKPPAGLDSAGSRDAVRVFEGNALDACLAFPRNVNIAGSLALAGIGGELTRVEIVVDPALERNVHEVEIDSDSTLLKIRIENRPSATNPRSSAIAAQSVCAVLAGLVDTVRIGT